MWCIYVLVSFGFNSGCFSCVALTQPQVKQYKAHMQLFFLSAAYVTSSVCALRPLPLARWASRTRITVFQFVFICVRVLCAAGIDDQSLTVTFSAIST